MEYLGLCILHAHKYAFVLPLLVRFINYIRITHLLYHTHHTRLFSILKSIAMLGSILLVASLALPSIATAPTYFTFNSVAAALPDNLYDTSNGASIEIEITDPATKTSTKCIKKWQPEATFYGPADWMACTDPTFSFRFNNFVNITEWTVGVRHQYRG